MPPLVRKKLEAPHNRERRQTTTTTPEGRRWGCEEPHRSGTRTRLRSGSREGAGAAAAVTREFLRQAAAAGGDGNHNVIDYTYDQK